MARLAMVIDTALCVGCSDCVVACKAENDVPEGFCRDWIVEEVRGVFPKVRLEIQSQRCNHCGNPPCVSCCPTGASHIHDYGGVVLVDKDKCIGCKACITACPYDARYVHPDGYVDKCTFCIHRVEKGLQPACVSVCPTRCMHFGDLEDSESDVSKLLESRQHHTLLPEAGTEPHVYFLKKG
jgi:Fe-S-cluster-containing dehydrogenase component